jgi:hypothetical protein
MAEAAENAAVTGTHMEGERKRRNTQAEASVRTATMKAAGTAVVIPAMPLGAGMGTHTTPTP